VFFQVLYKTENFNLIFRKEFHGQKTVYFQKRGEKPYRYLFITSDCSAPSMKYGDTNHVYNLVF